MSCKGPLSICASVEVLPRGVYIYGDPGAGKTMMMDMFFEAVKRPSVLCCREELGVPTQRAQAALSSTFQFGHWAKVTKSH